jgi:alpha-galactosidase
VSAGLARRHDPSRTRAQALQLALRTLREGAGEDTFILGCSCPLGAGIGWVDAMRISADTSHAWYGFPIPWDKTNLPGGANMFRNVLVRQVLHGRWWINNRLKLN